MNQAWVILNASKKKYLVTGDWGYAASNLTDNPLLAHIYATQEIAERLTRTMINMYTKRYKKDIDLQVCEIRGDVTAKYAKPEPDEPKSGYAIKVTLRYTDGRANLRQTSYFKNRYQMQKRIVDPSDVYYRSLRYVLSNHTGVEMVPTLWKTRAGAEKIMNQLVEHVSETADRASVEYEIVEYTES